MSDVVVIETAPAEIVEVVAVGPQGPVGDVNPQMPVILAATEAARDAALVSKLAAAASQSAAATSAANAATSESNAATSAATATAQATASAGSATDSAGSAAAAQASATNAATSETNAANSATASANSATSSANSATAAQAAQTATESARDTTLATIGTAALKANNLSDLANAATARSNLGLGNVNNTSDANKPISTATQAALDLKENAANKGVANGYAGLDAAGKVPANQLPSYVDDVLEFANLATFPATGEAGKIYVALDTNKTYRWSGSAYIYITSGAVDSVAGKTGVVTLVKADVGLGSVDNTSDADKPISTATQAALNLKANAASPTTTGTFTHSGDIVLSGSGKRITGDFSDATLANRVMFQTSTVNGLSSIGVLPNGTNTFANLNLFGGSDPANASVGQLVNTGTEVRLSATATGTGTYPPMTFHTSGSERMRIDTSGNVGIGTSNPAGKLHAVDSSATNTALFERTSSITDSVLLSVRVLATSSGDMINGFGPLITFNIQDSANVVNPIGQIGAVRDGADNSGALVFRNYASGTQSERMRIDSSGRLLVGTAAPLSDTATLVVRGTSGLRASSIFEVQNTSGDFAQCQFINPNGIVGSIRTNGSNTSYATSSDYRLKEDIQPMQNALAVVQQLNPVTYTWKADGSDGQGFIAHELQAVVPDCVTGEKDAVDADGNPVYQGIDTSFLVATLVAAIQELKSDFDAYKATHP